MLVKENVFFQPTVLNTVALMVQGCVRPGRPWRAVSLSVCLYRMYSL